MRCRSVAVPRAKASKAKAAKPKRAPEPVVDLPLGHSEQALVDRYYAMAEELNGRGSMELAVPFYRLSGSSYERYLPMPQRRSRPPRMWME